MRRREERGAVTVEATISLTAFMFLIMTILSIVNICVAQAKIGIAINATAKELSQYCYLYSLTGLDKSLGGLAESAAGAAEDIGAKGNKIIDGVGTVFSAIQDLGNDAKIDPTDFSGTASNLEASLKDVDRIKEGSSEVMATLEEMAKDPKTMIMGLAKIAASDLLDATVSHLVAAPLAKGLCKKNLTGERDGDVEAYLRGLGVQPGANGSYLNGLDFSGSSMFANGSNVICVNVTYAVRVLKLLPVDVVLHFNQSAVTEGWLCGEETYKTAKQTIDIQKAQNHTLWTDSTDPKQRTQLMRDQCLTEYAEEGYEKVTGGSFSDIQAYNSTTNDFLMVHAINPLYSPQGEATLTLDDINENTLKEKIETFCAGTADTVRRRKEISTKGSENPYACEGATATIVLIIPEDEGLEKKMKEILAKCDTQGMTVEIVPSYGKGANSSDVEEQKPKAGGDVE